MNLTQSRSVSVVTFAFGLKSSGTFYELTVSVDSNMGETLDRVTFSISGKLKIIQSITVKR